MSIIVRPETTADQEAVRHVNRLAFGQNDEARLVDTLRVGGFVRVSLVAERAGQVVGHNQLNGSREAVIQQAMILVAAHFIGSGRCPGWRYLSWRPCHRRSPPGWLKLGRI